MISFVVAQTHSMCYVCTYVFFHHHHPILHALQFIVLAQRLLDLRFSRNYFDYFCLIRCVYVERKCLITLTKYKRDYQFSVFNLCPFDTAHTHTSVRSISFLVAVVAIFFLSIKIDTDTYFIWADLLLDSIKTGKQSLQTRISICSKTFSFSFCLLGNNILNNRWLILSKMVWHFFCERKTSQQFVSDSMGKCDAK